MISAKFAAVLLILGTAPAAIPQSQSPPPGFCSPCVVADMQTLASDAMRGRGSATPDEEHAAQFAAGLFHSLGLVPGGDGQAFLQRVPLPDPLPPNAAQRLKNFEAVPRTETWNVVGLLPASGGKTQGEAILLSAHLDHLGVGPAVDGDAIYNGADDDASGATAVLELARALKGRRLKRTVIFALFGSEEIGGFGDRYFMEHPPVPLGRIVANLEFEMIGRPDPLLPPGRCWLTGYERSDLGPELVRHGARLAADPRPQQNFFRRSDNYALARNGVVAHTVSSFGLHSDYHRPSDDLSNIDFHHLAGVIAGMIEPIQWLANTDWKPQWINSGAGGGQPR